MKMRFLLLAAAFACAVPASAGAVVAVTISNTTGAALTNPPFTLGWAFTVNSDILVNGLGLFDSAQDGLAEAHDLGLWTSTGTLLASTTIGSGSSGTLIDQFRYSSIAPTLLTSGGSYLIGGLYTSGLDGVVENASGLIADSAITYGGGRFAPGGTLSAPTSTGTPAGYFGTNFTFDNGAVPEPATWAFMIVGFGAVGAALRMSRKKAALPAAA